MPAQSDSTRPVPADRDRPIDQPSTLADLAIRAGVCADDVRAYLTSPYRYVRSDLGLMQVSQ